jgi:hypothetical protein
MLITRSLLYDEPSTTFLIRLGHQYAVNEDEKLSHSVEVDLSVCVPPSYTISNVVEMTLCGNQGHSALLEKRLDWSGGTKVSRRSTLHGTKVILTPMDIQTFLVSVAPTVLHLYCSVSFCAPIYRNAILWHISTVRVVQ